MDKSERFYRIIGMLNNRLSVSRSQFLEELEVSPATFKRDLEYLRDRFNAPIIYDSELRGYRFELINNETFQLPGLWFNDSEIYALLIMEHLLENLTPGLLSPHIEPMRAQVNAILDKTGHSLENIKEKIRVLPQAARRYELEAFEALCQGLLSSNRVQIRQYSRQRDEYTEREISPQRLVHYRDNWYLDAYCHMRKDLRTFAVDTIKSATVVNTKSRTISKKQLDEVLQAGYGIFSGKDTQVAHLVFTPERSRWVSREEWHPQQQSHFDEQGNYHLELPYSNEHELIMDILKYGPDVSVLSPQALRKSVIAKLDQTRKNYS